MGLFGSCVRNGPLTFLGGIGGSGTGMAGVLGIACCLGGFAVPETQKPGGQSAGSRCEQF
jgi:hypothetical protein